MQLFHLIFTGALGQFANLQFAQFFLESTLEASLDNFTLVASFESHTWDCPLVNNLGNFVWALVQN